MQHPFSVFPESPRDICISIQLKKPMMSTLIDVNSARTSLVLIVWGLWTGGPIRKAAGTVWGSAESERLAKKKQKEKIMLY
jgi:hypothetical protein